MKEETKSKLRKFCKVSAYVGGLFAMLLLGMGLGNCSARKSVGSNAEDSGLRSLQPRKVAPPLSPVDFPTLDECEDNLLFNAVGGHFVPNGAGDDFQFTANDSYDTYLLRDLSVGLYALDIDSTRDGWSGCRMLLNDSGASSAQNGITYASGFTVNAINFIDSDSLNTYGKFKRIYITITSSHDNLLFSLFHGGNAKVTFIDATELPASHVITFPNDYNPLSGFGTPSDGLVGQLAGGKSSPFRLDVYFRSGGQIFKRIDFYFLPMQSMEYVSTLSSSGTPSVFTGSGFVYASTIEYISYDGTSLTAWRAIFGTKADGNLYLRNFGEWASKQYQTIDVFDYTPVYGQSGVASNLDQIGILELRTGSGVPTPIIGGNSNADVFSLLGVGFQSVAGLLNIQILPFLTLGTLLFVPLVVIIIFAILKVLNK